MKVSFIIPAYNEEKYIAGCLEAIYNLEGLMDFEIIVVDNNSTDKTAEVVQKEFPKVTVLHEKRKGPNWARQKGFEGSQGELLVFFDSDSRPPRDWLTKLKAVFKSQKELVSISGPYVYTQVGFLFNVCINKMYNYFWAPVFSWVFLKIKGTAIYFGGNMIVRKKALDKIGGIDTGYTFYGDDTNLGRRLAEVGKVRFVSSIWVYASSRRFKNKGVLKTFFIYTINFVWEAIFHKPFTK